MAHPNSKLRASLVREPACLDTTGTNMAGNCVNELVALEICAGGGGQALGLELAGFSHAACVEIDHAACETLRVNRPQWNVVEGDLHDLDGQRFVGIDLLAGGVPCPPFSIAGKQLGADDERDLFPVALRLIQEIQPKAVMLENVRGLSAAKFANYREAITIRLGELGYRSDWRLLNSSDYGVPQLRPRFILVALRTAYADQFAWPVPIGKSPTVGATLYDLMASRGWPGADAWAKAADAVAPTIVGGSKKHGGPDLGPTRAKLQWARLGVDGSGIAELPPGPDFGINSMPKLTVQMVARVQGFPDTWIFSGKKTPAYRQVGNALPPPVAAAMGLAIRHALTPNAGVVPAANGLSKLPLMELFGRSTSAEESEY